MPKALVTDPSPKKESPESESIDSLNDCVAGVKEEVRHLVAQTCDVSQELMHLNAGISDLQEAVVVLTAALLSDPNRGSNEELANARLYQLQQLFAE